MNTYIKVFLARFLNVFLGTVATSYSVKGKGLVASIFSFCEVLIWYYATKKALLSNNSVLMSLFFASGYALGTYLGTTFSSKYINEILSVNVITDNDEIEKTLKENGYGVSSIKLNNDKYLLIIILNKKNKVKLLREIKKMDSHSFIYINSMQNCENGFIKEKKLLL